MAISAPVFIRSLRFETLLPGRISYAPQNATYALRMTLHGNGMDLESDP